MFLLLDFSNQVAVFEKLDKYTKDRGVKFPFPTKDFYFRLLQYCIKNDLFDEEKNAYFVDLSVSSLGKVFEISSNHVIQTAITSLIDVGLIERIKFKPCFTKLPSGEYITNKPSRIYILSYLLQD